jgi:hypothetical protein
MELEGLQKIDEISLLNIVKNKSEEFEKFQEELIGLFMPLDIPAQQAAPTLNRAIFKRG